MHTQVRAPDLAPAQRMLPEIFQMLLSLDEKLPTMLPVVVKWRLPLFKAVSALCNYSAAALEAVVVVSQCSEILLSVALAFTRTLAFYLSTMLRLNAFLRLTLAGVLHSREELLLDQRGRRSCSTWSSYDSCSHLCCGGGGGRTARCLVLHGVPALCRCSLSVCKTLLSVCSASKPSVSTFLTLCGSVRPLLSTLQTVTSYSTQVLGIIWDVASVMSST